MTATDTAVHRDFRVDVRAERKRLSAYAAESRAAEAELTAQYGGDWLKKLTVFFTYYFTVFRN
jgi:2-keto-3-deoxy-L-rhamnonate aldolase RhmA